MENVKIRYFTFPICILNQSFINIKTVCNDIMEFAIYKHSLSMEKETEKERMLMALNYYGVKPGNLKLMIENGKLIFNSIPEHTVLTSINKDMIFDYYKNYKSEFDIACFLAFAAIKSILGKKSYCKTNKEMIIARMFSLNSMKDLFGNKNEMLVKYSNRYHIDKVLIELQINWHLNLFSDHCRGFYLSFDVPLEQLAKINIEVKKSTKLNELRNAKKEALKAAKESLNNQ